MFARVHALNEEIPAVFYSENLVRKLFAEGTLDLLCDDFIYKILVYVQPYVEEYLGIDVMQADNTVNMLNVVVSLGLFVLSLNYPDVYDSATNAIFGVPVEHLYKIGVFDEGDASIPVVEIYLDNLLEELIFGKVGEGLLY